MNQHASTSIEPMNTTSASPTIPAGFALLVGPDGEDVFVPAFLIPATHQAFDGYRKQLELDVRKEEGGVRIDLWITWHSSPAPMPTPTPRHVGLPYD
jgi:hypothetical protein